MNLRILTLVVSFGTFLSIAYSQDPGTIYKLRLYRYNSRIEPNYPNARVYYFFK